MDKNEYTIDFEYIKPKGVLFLVLHNKKEWTILWSPSSYGVRGQKGMGNCLESMNHGVHGQKRKGICLESMDKKE